LDAGSVKTLQDCLEGIGPVGGLKDDFQEIGGLGYALIFKTLRTTLLILLAIVRVGALGAGYIERWLDDKAIGERNRDYYKDAGRADQDSFTNDITGFTDRKEPVRTHKGLQASVKDSTNDQTHLMDYSTDLLYTTFPHPSVSVLLVTLSTATTPSSSSSSDSQESLQTFPLQQATMSTMFYMLMPPPGTPRSPMFKGANVTEFLKRYEDLCSDYRVTDKDRLIRLPRYYIQPIAETIKSLKEWKNRDYTALKKVLLAEYRNDDTHQLLYSVPFLKKYKNIVRTEKDDVLDYCRKFDRIA